jgi:hypothetical protein
MYVSSKSAVVHRYSNNICTAQLIEHDDVECGTGIILRQVKVKAL